jgi:Protein of unknown function (Hypoth_ymh)
MSEGIEVQLSPRIQKHCLKLWQDEHYKHAAREAVVQVELALKEKGMVKDGKFGKTLIDSLFTIGGKHKTVKEISRNEFTHLPVELECPISVSLDCDAISFQSLASPFYSRRFPSRRTLGLI